MSSDDIFCKLPPYKLCYFLNLKDYLLYSSGVILPSTWAGSLPMFFTKFPTRQAVWLREDQMGCQVTWVHLLSLLYIFWGPANHLIFGPSFHLEKNSLLQFFIDSIRMNFSGDRQTLLGKLKPPDNRRTFLSSGPQSNWPRAPTNMHITGWFSSKV